MYNHLWRHTDIKLFYVSAKAIKQSVFHHNLAATHTISNKWGIAITLGYMKIDPPKKEEIIQEPIEADEPPRIRRVVVTCEK